MLFESFPLNSKVWVYTAKRNFNEQEKIFIQSNLDAFLSQWNTHGKDLFANGSILHDTFIVIVSDESKIQSSGCSVDSSVRFIKDLGRELNIDFFDRLNVIVEKEGEMKRVHFNDLANYSSWNIFNPLVNNLDGLRNNWLIPVDKSQFVK